MNKFYTDAMLGKLTKFLRILGYDTLYRGDESLTEMLYRAGKDDRIVLTRSKNVLNIAISVGLKAKLLNSVDVVEQLKALSEENYIRIMLYPTNPRCSECNGTIKKVDKEAVIKIIPKGTAKYYNTFWQCNNCRKVYWIGQHWSDIRKKLELANR